MNFEKLTYALLMFLLFSANLDAYIKSGTCDPYYASIKSNEANSHRGPGKEYKISFKYIQKGTPVMIIAKYDHWRKIRDALGDESWIHKNMLSPKRFVIIVNDKARLMSQTNNASKTIAYVKKNVVMELVSVRGKWCNVVSHGNNGKYTGWIKKSDVFGVFENEIL